MVVFRYDQTATQVKALGNRAERLSSEARDENILANNMHKNITNLEQEVPSSLKVVDQELTLSEHGALTCVPLFRMGWTAWPLCWAT